MRFPEASRAGWTLGGWILKSPTAPSGYTPNTVVTEWRTLNCRGPWASSGVASAAEAASAHGWRLPASCATSRPLRGRGETGRRNGLRRNDLSALGETPDVEPLKFGEPFTGDPEPSRGASLRKV